MITVIVITIIGHRCVIPILINVHRYIDSDVDIIIKCDVITVCVLCSYMLLLKCTLFEKYFDNMIYDWF